jgi:hypothetical protein
MTIRVPHKLAFAGLTLSGVVLSCLLLLALSVQARADWQGQVSPRDVERLAHLNDAREDALEQARHRGGHGDVRAIGAVFDPAPRSVPEQALAGTWRCRQIKLGGMTGYYVFDWFKCRISRVNGTLWLEKNGTQRMAGFLHPQEGMWVYLGAQSAKGEPIHRYSGRAVSAGEDINPDDQVGVLVGIGNNHLRLDLPSPATQESDFDSIELVR